MRRAWFYLLCPLLLASAILPTALRGQAAGRAPAAAKPPIEVPFTSEKGGPRHSGSYQPLTLAWSNPPKLEKVLGVFAHPLLPRRAAVVTAAGLYLTDDYGVTFKPVPEASAEKVGLVRWVEFSGNSPDTFWLATAAKGVWMSADLGKTLAQVGTKQSGLAGDAVEAVYAYPADVGGATLLAIFGDAARGISVSHDAGRAWETFATSFNVHGLVFAGAGSGDLYMLASRKDDPDIHCIYQAYYAGENWVEMVRDVMPTGGAQPVLRDRNAYISTADAGLYQVNATAAAKIGPADVRGFADVGVTWGPHADTQLFYMYEPAKLGMAWSTDSLRSVSAQNEGLVTGPFVKEGAHIRANANGTVFYAVANGALAVGRNEPPGFPSVSEVEVSPPVFSCRPHAYEEAITDIRKRAQAMSKGKSAAEAAKIMMDQMDAAKSSLGPTKFTITARVTGEGKLAPKVVSVDLSRLGLSQRTAMVDDGQHGDGAANDGVFGAVFTIDPKNIVRNDQDWRKHPPGVEPLTVSALTEDETVAGAVGLLNILNLPESFLFWDEEKPEKFPSEAVGATVWPFDTASAYSGRQCLKIAAGAGKWSCIFGAFEQYNLFGMYAVSFYVKTDNPGGGDLCVALRDNTFERGSVTGQFVPIEKENFVDGGGLGKEYRRVVIPINRLAKGCPDLHLNKVSHLVFSGDGKTPVTYWIDCIRFHATPEELKK
jgi:hypothetical protein